MNQKIVIFILILSGVFSACQNTGKSEQNELPLAYFEGTYRFSEFESMTIGTWFVADSSCMLLKRKDADKEFNASSGFVRKSGDLYILDAGNEGRLVFRYENQQLEILNNEGEPISRDSKFILSKIGKCPDPNQVFSTQVWFPGSDPGVITFCPSNIRMKFQYEQMDTIQQISANNKVFEAQLSVIQDDMSQTLQLKLIRIKQELNVENCK
jgi:hypothetical protein